MAVLINIKDHPVKAESMSSRQTAAARIRKHSFRGFCSEAAGVSRSSINWSQKKQPSATAVMETALDAAFRKCMDMRLLFSTKMESASVKNATMYAQIIRSRLFSSSFRFLLVQRRNKKVVA